MIPASFALNVSKMEIIKATNIMPKRLEGDVVTAVIKKHGLKQASAKTIQARRRKYK